MAKFDEKLDRMNYLMEFRSPSSKSANSPIEYHTVGADGKVYGILKEGTKYYIKTTQKGKENIKESYDYLNGFNNKRDCEYNGYNEATKHLELKLMSLNEAYGVKKNVSTVDFSKGQKNFSYLTEEARKELDRMNQIFENSGKIGKDNTAPVEYHGTASPDNTQKNNAPFSETASATLDKDIKATQNNPAKATGSDYTSVSKNINADLQSDKMKGKGESGNQCFDENVKDSDIDSEGSAIAAQKKEGAKAVKMNESYDEYGMEETPDTDYMNGTTNHNEDAMFDPTDTYDMEYPDEPEDNPFGDYDDGNEYGSSEGEENIDLTDNGIDDIDNEGFNGTATEELVGDEEGDEDDLDAILNEMEQTYMGGDFSNKDKDIITGPEDTLDGPNTTDIKSNSIAYGEPHVGGDNGVMNECGDAQFDDSLNENEDNTEPEKTGEESMQGPDIHGTKSPFETKDGSLAYGEKRVGQLNESMLEGLVSDVCRKLLSEGKKKESLKEAIQRMVNEEVTRLNYWGKHPRYQKEPMQLPPNKEVMKGTADRDWNDDSAKGEQPYGRKIGSSAPFDKKVDAITDSVLQIIKESLKNRR